MLACFGASEPVLQLLLKHNTRTHIDLRDKEGQVRASVSMLVAHQASPVQTALISVASRGRDALVRQLLAAHADPYARDRSGKVATLSVLAARADSSPCRLL